MKLEAQSGLKLPATGWLQRWAPLFGLLIVIGIGLIAYGVYCGARAALAKLQTGGRA